MISRRFALPFLAFLGLSTAVLVGLASGVPRSAVTLKTTQSFPNSAVAMPTPTGEQSIVLAGGCFWGMEGVFEHLKGVSDVVSGYAGGSASDAHYERVGSGQTGHAEAIKVTYNPAQISYGQILKVFFAVAHDPTQLNQQEPDQGPQYRSAIFVSDAAQKQMSQTYINQLNAAKVFKAPIATQLSSLDQFYVAEGYHQNFIARNPAHPYVVVHDLPKIERLREVFPDLYKP
jgi:peptide-methionine (S)-S-oxide reductase